MLLIILGISNPLIIYSIHAKNVTFWAYTNTRRDCYKIIVFNKLVVCLTQYGLIVIRYTYPLPTLRLFLQDLR